MAVPGVNIIGSDNSVIGANGAITTASATSGITATQPYTNTALAAQAGAATVKATAGRLFGVTVTTTGVTPLVVTDGSGGTTIFELPASPVVGYYGIAPAGNVFNTSLVVVGSATNPAIVLHYS
jgi:hypothetical protein